ncbi:MAG: transcriptional repressor LexA [Desulfobacterota bacterium]|nr:transcriptional repressor LexA [Thermodesulfobacteriota bacterium]MDW8002818.1 transcriptional repressor LexA [Deltaproteobacteria bacterium]
MESKKETRKEICMFIRNFMEEKGYSPTVREIMKGCKISSPSVVHYHLIKLEKEGYIEKDPQIGRGIRLKDREVLEIPLLGVISAGKPLPVFDDSFTYEETIKVTKDIVGRKKNVYAVKVKGNSMRDAMIEDGDIVIMESKSTAENGEMVGVWLKKEQEVTLKRIYFEKDRIKLKPENDEMEPIYTDYENVEIQGKVIAVVRKL